MMYDTLQGGSGPVFSVVDPSTGRAGSALDLDRAITGLRAHPDASSLPAKLGWPEGFDGAGERAVYLLGGDVYLLFLSEARFERLTHTPEEEQCAGISPDGHLVAYVRNNDLYVWDVARRAERRLTRDGSSTTLNGRLSWVYWEEIFGHHEAAYWWSPDSKTIAFLRTDESGVGATTFTGVEPWRPRVYTQRYPEAGEKTPMVRVGFVPARGGRTVWMRLPARSYEYITGVDWLPGGGSAAVQAMNRAQTRVDLYFVRASDGRAARVLEERDDAWVHMYRPLFTGDGNQFLWVSERSGYAHAYLYGGDGTLIHQVTRGEWPLRPYGAFAIYDAGPLQAVDRRSGWLYFTAAKDSSIGRQVYRVHLDGSGMERISREAGYHRPSFRSDGLYYVESYSNAGTPPSLLLRRGDGTLVRVLSRARPGLIPGPPPVIPSFFHIAAPDGFPLPAAISVPAGFDSTKRYPVIVYVYGGPGSPSVSDEWNASGWAESIYADQLLLHQGCIVFTFDNRSSACAGKVYEKTILGQMYGDVELGDLRAAVGWLKRRPFVDTSRVGIWGWSGGGTYTLLAMTRTSEFRAGVAVAPVTDWRYYDAKWAELPMKLPGENRKGYDHTSLVQRAGDLHGRLMLVYGTFDDNVHPQNSQAFMNELIRRRTPFDLMVYPVRKHTIDDAPAKIHLWTMMLEFWKRNL